MPRKRESADQREWQHRFGHVLGVYRERVESQEKAAEFLEVDKDTVSRWELGRNAIRAWTAMVLIARYEIPLEWFFEPPEVPLSEAEVDVRKSVAAGLTEAVELRRRRRRPGPPAGRKRGPRRPSLPAGGSKE